MLVKYELTKSEPRDHVKKRNYEEEKEVVHIEFDLPEESELTFTAGDALGVYPLNKPSEVAVLLSALVGHPAHSEKGKEKEEDTGRPILSLVLPVFNENVGVESGILIAQFYLRDKAYQYHSALLAMGTCLYAP